MDRTRPFFVLYTLTLLRGEEPGKGRVPALFGTGWGASAVHIVVRWVARSPLVGVSDRHFVPLSPRRIPD